MAMNLLFLIGISALFLGGSFLIGKAIDKSHLESLKSRERACNDFVVSTLRDPEELSGDRVPMLVVGEVVLSSDYFKDFIFSLRNVIGGESRTFTRVYDRARREATLRMIESARDAGFTAVCNVRYDSVDICGNATATGQKKSVVTCLVSGTAYMKA